MFEKIKSLFSSSPVQSVPPSNDRLAVDPNPRILMEEWGELLDPREYLSDSPGFGASSIIGGDANARKDGQYWPFIKTETDLMEIRALARAVVQISPSAQCVMNNLTSYILGNGFTYSVVDKKPKGELQNKEEVSELAAAVGKIIDEFLAHNQWCLKTEPEALRRAYRDGEFFIAAFKSKKGIASVRFVEPEYVLEPTDSKALEQQEGLCCDDEPINWNFGIATAHDDVQTVYGYHVQWPGMNCNGDFFPTSRMVHCKMGVDSTIKRGISDYYSVVEYLNDGAKLLRNTTKGAAILAAIAAITEHAPGVSKDAVESLVSGSSFKTIQKTGGTSSSAKTRRIIKYEPGSIMHSPNGQKMSPGPLSNNSMGETCMAIEQGVLRIVGSRWCMPEYMVSGDASNANYASTLVAESPFVKYCERMQQFFSWTFEEVLWLVLGIAIESGRLKFQGTIDDLKKFITIAIEPPQVSSRNAKEETDRRAVLSNAGLLSDPTWSAQEGLDREQELANGVAKAETLATLASGLSTNGETNSTTTSTTPTQSAMTFNGAQIAAAAGIAANVAKGDMPRSAGIGQLQILFGLTPEQANEMLGNPAETLQVKSQPAEPTLESFGRDFILEENAGQLHLRSRHPMSRIELAQRLLWDGYPEKRTP
jgi:hypothetical protein